MIFKNRKGDLINKDKRNILLDEVFEQYNKDINYEDINKQENETENEDNYDNNKNDQFLTKNEKIEFVGENVSENYEEQRDIYEEPDMANYNNSYGKPKHNVNNNSLSDDSAQNNKDINELAKILLDDESLNLSQNSEIRHGQ